MANMLEYQYKARWGIKLKEMDSWKGIPSNIKDAKQFLKICEGQKDLSYTRLNKYFSILKNLVKWAKFDFSKATRDDITELTRRIRQQNYSAETEKDYKVTIKYLFKIVYGKDEDYPSCVRSINTTIGRHHQKKRGDVFTPKDIQRILEYLTHPRDKALISFAFEGGARPSEYLTLKLRDVNNFKEKSGVLTCKVEVAGKTGRRTIYCTDIAPVYLYDWITKHPDKDNKDAFLWPPKKSSNSKGEMLTLASARKILRQACFNLGIDKTDNLYWIRHSGITKDHKEGITQQVANNKFGWSRTSTQHATYVHLSGRDYEEMEDRRKGLVEEEKEETSQQKRCWYCNTLNGIAEAICSQCSKPLDLDAMEKKQNNDLTELKEDYADMRKQLQAMTRLIAKEKGIKVE